RGTADAGDDALDLLERRTRHVRHEVALPLCAQYRFERGRELTRGAFSFGAGRQARSRDQPRRGFEDRLDLAQAVHLQRRTGGGDVHDDVGYTEVWRNLRCAGNGNDRDIALAGREACTRHGRKYGRDPSTGGHIAHVLDVRVLAHRDDDTATAEPEIEYIQYVTAALDDEVEAGDPEIRGAIGHELRDVLRAHEQRDELAPERRLQRALARGLERETRPFEQVACLRREPALVRKCNPDHRRFSSTKKAAARQWTGRGRKTSCVASPAERATRLRPDPSGRDDGRDRHAARNANS